MFLSLNVRSELGFYSLNILGIQNRPKMEPYERQTTTILCWKSCIDFIDYKIGHKRNSKFELKEAWNLAHALVTRHHLWTVVQSMVRDWVCSLRCTKISTSVIWKMWTTFGQLIGRPFYTSVASMIDYVPSHPINKGFHGSQIILRPSMGPINLKCTLWFLCDIFVCVSLRYCCTKPILYRYYGSQKATGLLKDGQTQVNFPILSVD